MRLKADEKRGVTTQKLTSEEIPKAGTDEYYSIFILTYLIPLFSEPNVIFHLGYGRVKDDSTVAEIDHDGMPVSFAVLERSECWIDVNDIGWVENLPEAGRFSVWFFKVGSAERGKVRAGT